VESSCEFGIEPSGSMKYWETITILDFIHRPVFYLKYLVSETGFCLRLQVKSHFGRIDRASLCLWTPAIVIVTIILILIFMDIH
jgi:hypothetical protein